MAAKPEKAKIVIVGAGAAGIAAATRLHEYGFDAVVLEAENRIGGRILDYKKDKGSTGWVELGAQWIHGEQHWLFDYARDHNLLAPSVHMNRQFAALFYNRSHPTTTDFATLSKLAGCFSAQFTPETLADFPPTMSVGERLKEVYKGQSDEFPDDRKNVEAVYDWTARCLKLDCGADSLHDVSVRNYRDEICIGNYNHQFKLPYVTILDHLLGAHNSGTSAFPVDKIRLCSPVSSIKLQANEGIVVRTAKGDVIAADHALVTVSLGVLKKYHGSLFSTPLSRRKQEAIQSMGYGKIGKVVLFYDEPFWTKWKFDYVDGETRALGLFWDDDLDEGKADPQKRYANKPWYRAIRSLLICQTHPNVLIAFLAGKQVDTMECLPETKIGEDLTVMLRQFSAATTIPPPVDIIKSAWSTNEHFLGTYSYISRGSGLKDFCSVDLAEPEWVDTSPSGLPRLLFAGEATHPEYFSMVHGAILSGWREADRLISLYR